MGSAASGIKRLGLAESQSIPRQNYEEECLPLVTSNNVFFGS